MGKRSFEDWLGDLREMARDEMGCELDEVTGYDEESAYDSFKDGDTPKRYLRGVSQRDREEDVTELMREL